MDTVAKSLRAALGVVLGMVAVKAEAALPGTHGAPVDSPSPTQPSAMASLIGQLRHDAGLRARFVHDPHAVMRAHGVDPAPFDLHRLDAAGRQRLLVELAQQADDPTKPKDGSSPRPPDGTPPPDTRKPRNPAAPIYGPPPKPR